MKTGGPAFPSESRYYDSATMSLQPRDGMTLRDYFAARVMQALVEETSVTAADYFKAIAKLAYSHADAMLAERDKPSGDGGSP